MSELEQRLNAMLSNPQLMQQIASMAQAMGGETQNPASEQKEQPGPSFDPKLMQAIGQPGIDSNQKQLLQALSPYLSTYRVQKLERAMHAARLAGAASVFLNAGGLQMLTGR